MGDADLAFILTLPRCGSSTLRRLLDSHSRICCPAETQVSIAAADIMRSWTDYEVPGDPVIWRQAALDQVRSMVGALARAHLDASGKVLFCEKSLWNLKEAPLLAEAFPHARFICLYRHSMDFVASVAEVCRFGYTDFDLGNYVMHSPGNIVAALVRAWSDQTSMMRRFQLAHPDSVTVVRYEELVRYPATVIGQLFEFLGVDPEDEVLAEGLSRPHLSGRGDTKATIADELTTDSLGTGSAVPARSIPLGDLATMNALLDELGYPTVGAAWSTQPSPLRENLARPADLDRLERVFKMMTPESFARTGAPDELITRLVIEECAAAKSWVLDYRTGTVRAFHQDEHGDSNRGPENSTLVTTCRTFLSLAHGFLNMQDAYSRGAMRTRNDNPQNLSALRALSALLRSMTDEP